MRYGPSAVTPTEIGALYQYPVSLPALVRCGDLVNVFAHTRVGAVNYNECEESLKVKSSTQQNAVGL